MRIGVALLLSGCVHGGEEREREDPSFHVALVRWRAELADGTDAGSGCVLTNDKDAYGDQLVITAEPGDTVQLTETFQRFRTTAEAWSAHPNDDAFWCGQSGAERWASVRNPGCFDPLDLENAPALCSGSSVSLVASEIEPAGDYPELPYVKNVDGFRLTLELGSKGEQCFQDCDRGQRVEFFVK